MHEIKDCLDSRYHSTSLLYMLYRPNVSTKYSPAVKLWLFQFYCTAFCYVQLWAVPLRSSILQRVIHKSVFKFDLFCSASDMFAGISIRSFDAVKRTYLYILCKDCTRLTLVLSIFFLCFHPEYSRTLNEVIGQHAYMQSA